MPSRVAVTVNRELARQIENGELCAECGAEFVKGHGEVTVCEFCWTRLPLGEREFVKKAEHEERNRVAHINQARKRRKENR